MLVSEIKVKTILVKSKLPDAEFVINPYVGCQHGCLYCYARFMKRFSGHKEPWGEFVDVKINAPDLIPPTNHRRTDQSIIFGSVTDPYQPVEGKYQLTRKILARLVPLQPHLEILTKSDLVLRDVDLLRQFKECLVAISLSGLDDKVRKELEPLAPPVERRLAALKQLHQSKIKTALFISPILPELTDWPALVAQTRPFVDEYWFENLNLYPSIRGNIFSFLRSFRPALISEYRKIYAKGSNYWEPVKKEIGEFCQMKKVKYQIYFH